MFSQEQILRFLFIATIFERFALTEGHSEGCVKDALFLVSDN